jgi:hypothetical protein
MIDPSISGLALADAGCPTDEPAEFVAVGAKATSLLT